MSLNKVVLTNTSGFLSFLLQTNSAELFRFCFLRFVITFVFYIPAELYTLNIAFFFFLFRILELETSLLDDHLCCASTIYEICKGKSIPASLRAEVWQVCLDVQDKGNQLILFNEIYDLPEQNVLRDDCQQFVGKFVFCVDDIVQLQLILLCKDIVRFSYHLLTK